MNSVESAGLVEEVERDLQSLKWHLWNGNVEPALRVIDGLKHLLDGEEMGAGRQKLLKAVRECGTDIATNQAFIPDDGDRYRHHEAISTAVTESAVNQLVSKRMVKPQQMHWSQRGAHLL